MTSPPRPILLEGDPEHEMAEDALREQQAGVAQAVRDRPATVPREGVPPLPAFVLWEPRRSRLWPALVLGVLFLLGAAVVAAAFQATSSSPRRATRTTPLARPVPRPGTAAEPAPGEPAAASDVASSPTPVPSPAAAPTLEAGLDCGTLVGRGVPYGATVDYWYAEGAPGRMDRNGDGVPCESAYPTTVVSAYWGLATVGRDTLAAVADLPGGLTCGELESRGVDYAGVAAYYLREGEPQRMDRDANGVACEGTYSSAEVSAYFL